MGNNRQHTGSKVEGRWGDTSTPKATVWIRSVRLSIIFISLLLVFPSAMAALGPTLWLFKNVSLFSSIFCSVSIDMEGANGESGFLYHSNKETIFLS